MVARQQDEDFGKDHGLIHEAVVTGRKVGAGREFWTILAHNEELFRSTVSFVMSSGVQPTVVQPAGTNSYLRLLSDQPLIIGPTDGSEVLADAADVFTGYVDPDFRHYKADEPGPATQATPALVYELVQDATFTQMFRALSGDTAKLCLTQAQIKAFVKTHRDWLRTDGYATFFLFQSHGHFFVADVGFGVVGSLRVRVRHFEDGRVWNAGYRRRVVVPQLA